MRKGIKKSHKTRISILLEDEILEYFKKRAKEPNSDPYQTQINKELRRIMEAGESVGDSSTMNLRKAILKDMTFLKELKETLKKV